MTDLLPEYDVIVVGAGHAGCEAACAAAHLGSQTLLITLDMNKIAQMSCNPAIGGIAKGQIVREIDALGGMTGIVTDRSSIQFRMLNLSKGPAMWSPRSQCDRMKFSEHWRRILEQTEHLDLWQDDVTGLLVDGGEIRGVRTAMGICFYSRKVVDIFVELCKKIVDRYHEKVFQWIIFNEQNGILQKGPKMFFGAVCPENMNPQTFDNQLMHNTLIAHSLINEYIHQKGGKVMGMATVVQSYPETCHPLDTLESMKAQSEAYVFLDVFARGHYNSYYYANMQNEGTMPEILDGDLEILKKGITDSLSISYYMSTISHYGEESLTNINDVVIKKNPYLEMSEFGWTIDPIGLRITLRQLYDRYEMPIYIVENGFGYDDQIVDGKIEDDYRIDYMKKHIEQMKLAVKEGVDCRGYLAWGPVDILSSRAQMKKRYGMIYVNRDNHDLKDMKRIKKKSFDWFKQVIESNGEIL